MTFKSREINKFLNHRFDFDHQYKRTYDDWITAFKKSVALRAVDGCFTGLSSGYDSGALTHEMIKQGIKFKVWTIENQENTKIIKERLKRIKEYKIVKISVSELEAEKKYLSRKMINDKYTIRYDGRETDERILDDKASRALGLMCRLAKKEGRKIYLSTQGSDEIISDYALFPSQSELKGKYPVKLKEWYNFRRGCQYSYLLKEERIPAVYGIETRYPYLDVDLVQEFLWLAPELKNKFYKAPLHVYLTKNKVPFEIGVKRGFNPIGRNLTFLQNLRRFIDQRTYNTLFKKHMFVK
jgi:asparagine synthetase B (glutamine-hydrolysing)